MTTIVRRIALVFGALLLLVPTPKPANAESEPTDCPPPLVCDVPSCPIDSCSVSEPATYCDPEMTLGLLSGATFVDWNVVVACYGYFRDGESVLTNWSFSITIEESTGWSRLISDSGNRHFSRYNSAFAVGAGRHHCNLTPGVITTIRGTGNASNAFGTASASEGPLICN